MVRDLLTARGAGMTLELLPPAEGPGALITVGEPARDPFYRYRWQGRDLPSWSTIRHIAGIKQQIHAWALEGMVTEALAMGTTIAAAAVTGQPAAVDMVRRRLWDAATEERDRAARLGIKVHQAVETGVRPEIADADIARKLGSFHHWLARSGARILRHEYRIYNLTVGYGGTVDLLVVLPNGRVFVVDIKSGKNLWGEHALQVMGYLQGEFVGLDDVVDEGLTAFHRGVHGMAVLHLGDDFWEFRSLLPDQATWDAFRGLFTFAVWQHEHDDIESVTLAKRRSRT